MIKKIFVSHSSKDSELVDRIGRALEIISVETVAYEFEEPHEDEQDRDAIRRLMQECIGCFVFPTENARSSDITSSWLVAEASIAEEQEIPIIIFKENDSEYGINFPYFHILLSYDSEELSIHLQEMADNVQYYSRDNIKLPAERSSQTSVNTQLSDGAKKVGEQVGRAFLRSGGDPLEFSIVLLAMLSTVQFETDDLDEETQNYVTVSCPRCEMRFNYIGQQEWFQCPHCHTDMSSDVNSVA